MSTMKRGVKCLLLAVAVKLFSGGIGQVSAMPLKVFILAGQSNMEGQGGVKLEPNAPLAESGLLGRVRIAIGERAEVVFSK